MAETKIVFSFRNQKMKQNKSKDKEKQLCRIANTLLHNDILVDCP